jgi:hypothetical protein
MKVTFLTLSSWQAVEQDLTLGKFARLLQSRQSSALPLTLTKKNICENKLVCCVVVLTLMNQWLQYTTYTKV